MIDCILLKLEEVTELSQCPRKSLLSTRLKDLLKSDKFKHICYSKFHASHEAIVKYMYLVLAKVVIPKDKLPGIQCLVKKLSYMCIND